MKIQQNIKDKNLISSKKVIAYKPPRFTIAEWKNYIAARKRLKYKSEVIVEPRKANYFKVQASQFFRINIIQMCKFQESHNVLKLEKRLNIKPLLQTMINIKLF